MEFQLENISHYLTALDETVETTEKGVTRFLFEIKFAQKLAEVYPENKDPWGQLIGKSVSVFKNSIDSGMSLKEALNNAEDVLKPLSGVAKEFTVHYVGHAHIDMNWLWPWQETVDVCYKTFSTVDKLMNEYPDFKFSQSQTSVYKAMEDYSPATYDMIKERVKSGQWEVTANTWVEGDKNLASGESMVRQILYTKRYFREKFGIPFDAVNIDWEPDTFGHAWTYPQILNKAGIKRYYFCRAGKGHRLFLWQAPDGSKVLAWNDEKLWYLGPIQPEDVTEVLDHYAETGMKDYMIAYGVGDHGGGPTRKHLNMLKEMQKWPVFPNVKFSTTDEFFTIAEKYIDKLPVINDELNFTFRGCYTSQSNIKRANRFSENMLGSSEAFALLANKLCKQEYPSDQLYKGWINTLFNQFHDILPGSGIHETYQYSQGLFQDTKAHSDMIRERSLRAVVSNINTQGKGDVAITVFNPLAWMRTDTISVKVFEKFSKGDKFSLVDNEGNAVPMQSKFGSSYGYDYHQITFTASDIPGCGYKTFYLKKVLDEQCAAGAKVLYNGFNNKVIENEYLKVCVEAGSGAIVSLIDKKTNKEFVPCGQKIGLLQVLHESPNGMSAWVIGQIIKTTNLDENTFVEVIDRGPAKVTVRTKRKFNNSEITMDISLNAGIPRVDFAMDINWLEIGNSQIGGPLLKVAFPINAANCSYTYEIPFGSIKRDKQSEISSLSNSHNNPSSLGVIGEDVPAQKWVDISGVDSENASIGLCIVNDSKYGFDANGNTIRMSIVRSSYNPDPLPEIGKQTVEFAIYPHTGEFNNSDAARMGYEFNNRLEVQYSDPHNGRLADSMEVLDVMPINAVTAAVKKAEDDDSIIVRLYEADGVKTSVNIKLTLPVKEALETDLLEQPTGKVINVENGMFTVELNPYEIKTIKIK